MTLRIGRSGLACALVSIATLLGGCDVISRKQAMEPLSLYYTLGLGVGMLVLYVLFRSHLTEKRSHDLHRRFAEIFCALACAWLWRCCWPMARPGWLRDTSAACCTCPTATLPPPCC